MTGGLNRLGGVENDEGSKRSRLMAALPLHLLPSLAAAVEKRPVENHGGVQVIIFVQELIFEITYIKAPFTSTLSTIHQRHLSTTQITMAPQARRPYQDAHLHSNMPPHQFVSPGACRYDPPLSQRKSVSIQPFGNQTPQFQATAMSDVGNMRIGSMAVNMNVENMMKSSLCMSFPALEGYDLS